jgi:hypothetical protein
MLRHRIPPDISCRCRAGIVEFTWSWRSFYTRHVFLDALTRWIGEPSSVAIGSDKLNNLARQRAEICDRCLAVVAAVSPLVAVHVAVCIAVGVAVAVDAAVSKGGCTPNLPISLAVHMGMWIAATQAAIVKWDHYWQRL